MVMMSEDLKGQKRGQIELREKESKVKKQEKESKHEEQLGKNQETERTETAKHNKP